MYVHIGNQECAADEAVGMEGHPGFPGNQNILSKYNLSAWMTEMNQSFVLPEMGLRDPFECVQTYCACRVEYFKHALLPVDLHLLQKRE